MRTLRLPAPAKVNLGLRITGVRDDGYHTLDSVFVPLDLADQVRLEISQLPGSPPVSLTLTGEAAAGIPTGPDNLALRAGCAFLAEAGLSAGLRIGLDKQIPAGAGLGGGSSDAGAVLRGLAELFPDAAASLDLPALALGLGADVPFFLAPRPSRVSGIGERIEPLGGLPALALLLARPRISLATAQVYAAWDEAEGALTRKPPRPTMPPVFGPGLSASALRELLENDLEAPAVRLCPAIARLEEQIGSLGALAVGMSGSGATVFGIFDDLAAAREAYDKSQWASERSEIWARVATTEPSG